MKTVLVTGFSGFIGQNLVSHLSAKGFNVIGLGRKKYNDISIEQHTYNELAHLKQYDAIIHLAGKAHDTKNTSDQAEYFSANTELTQTVFDHFLRSTATDFIYLSSVKAAADVVESELTEDTPPKPATPYGLSKLKAEEYLLAAKLPAGKRLIILRPCMVHGPGNKGNLNLLFQFIKKKLPYPLAAFGNKRSLLSIQNLLHVIAHLLTDANISGGIYNIADDESLSTTQIIDILGETAGIKPKKWHINTGLINGLVRAVGLLKPQLKERVQKLTESYVVSNKKIKNAMGIQNMPVTSRDGLRHTAKYLQS